MRSMMTAGAVAMMSVTGVCLGQTVVKVNPTTVSAHDRMIISGSGFGVERLDSTVLINGTPAAVGSWSDTRISVHIPGGTATGPGTLEVVVSGNRSLPVGIDVIPDAPASGRIKWRLQTDFLYSQSRPAVSADGTVYVTGAGGPMYAVDPRGHVKWAVDGAGGVRPATVAPDGTVYYPGAGATITAAAPAGDVLWRYTAPDNAGTMFIGPNVGPDGKIYAVTEEEPSLGTDFGAFALERDGSLAWHTSGGYNFRHAPYGWEIVFSNGRLFFATGQGFPLTGNPGVHALDQEGGQERWRLPGISKVQADGLGRLYWLGAINNNFIGSYLSSGAERWTVSYNVFSGQPGGYVVAPDGTSFYGTQTNARFAALNADGSVRWTVSPGHQIYPYGALPDGSGAIVVSYRYSPTRLAFERRAVSTGAVEWTEPVPFENDVWMAPSWEGQFSPDGRTFYICGTGNNYITDPFSYLYAIRVGDDCRADQNGDGAVTSQDFFDFLGGFFAGAADFNEDGATNSQDLFDFLGAFFAGC